MNKYLPVGRFGELFRNIGKLEKAKLCDITNPFSQPENFSLCAPYEVGFPIDRDPFVDLQEPNGRPDQLFEACTDFYCSFHCFLGALKWAPFNPEWTDFSNRR